MLVFIAYYALAREVLSLLMRAARWHKVLLANAYHPLPPARARPSSGGGCGVGFAPQQEQVIAYVAEWFAQRILLDTSDLGISFSAPRWRPGACLSLLLQGDRVGF